MRISCLIVWLGLFHAAAAGQSTASFTVQPSTAALEGPFARLQLLVQSVPDAAGRPVDATREAQYSSADPSVAVVDPRGRVTPTGDGQTQIHVEYAGSRQTVDIEVRNTLDYAVQFDSDIVPILDKQGCATAACHASQYGKGGFKLSVFGFDPVADFEAMARAGRGRRIRPASPDASLLLQKPAMQVNHGGGKRLDMDSVQYATLRAWIVAGAPRPPQEPAHVDRLVVTPRHKVAREDETQQLRVEAHYRDGRVRDVTHLARYDTMDESILAVGIDGLVTAVGRGQSGVMIRYAGQAQVSTIVIPYREQIDLAGWQSFNLVDELATEKFSELGLEPSPLCDDATFLRRAFLDATGSLPPTAEVESFLASDDPDKREHLVDRLLGLTGNPELDVYNDAYAAYWTLKWSDLIRNNSNSLGEQGMWALHNWIRESFRVNRPFDEFVRELVTAKGSIYSNGPANYFRINNNSSALTEATAQLFMGVRLECAKCHHHPFENYSQADYYGLAAFFSRVGSKNSEEFGLFGRESVVTVRSSGEVSHPRTRQRMEPTPLGGAPVDDPLDRRIPLAQWLTSSDNGFFARSVVNRYFHYLLGVGLVEPVDDLRSTNPPSNEPLMEAMAEHFVESGYDLKQLMRTIMTSRLYQLSSQPAPANAADRRFYSHFYVKRLAAEPLLDAIDQATGTQTKFKSLPLGTRAIELPDAEYPNYFLTTFAKPRRATVCECERAPDENLAQALHTLNGDILAGKIAHAQGRVTALLAAKKPHPEIVREIYLATLCRPPTEVELALSNEFLEESASPKECYEDLQWALINSKQFLYVR